MQIYNLKDYLRGWVAGKFSEAIYNADFEVGVQYYNKGQSHDKHYHKEATEINIITQGECCFSFYDKDGKLLNHIIASQGDIIVIYPFEVTKFHAAKDCCLTVIKTKSIKNDKYIVK